jgi:hypothetical protein
MTRSALALALIAACSSGSDGTDPTDPASCTGKCDAASAKLPAPKLGSCMLVGGSGGHTVHCNYTAPPAEFPLKLKLTVAVTRQGGAASDLTNSFGSHVFTASGSADVLTVNSDQLPVMVMVLVDLEGPGSALTSAGEPDTLDAFNLTKTFGADGDSVRYDLPFTAWALTLDSSVVFDAKTDGYALVFTPWQTSFYSVASMTHAPTLPTLYPGSSGVPAVLVVPEGLDHVTGHYTGGSFTIPGPGHYSVGAGGFGKAGSGPVVTVVPDAPPQPIPDAPTTPDAPPPVDPSCGNQDQPRCADGSCHAGFVFDSYHQSCTACGAESEPRCADGSCHAGFVFDSYHQSCTACGTQDKPRCADGGCATGFVFDSYHQTCTACGAESEPRCADGSCNANFVYDSYHQTCTACGQGGQPACRDAGGNPVCADGFSYQSWNQTCQPS